MDEGAKLLLDGRNVKVAGFEQGNFVGPTIFDGVKENMTIYTEEIFGPVLCVVGVETLEDAVEFINRNPNGNGVALFTQDGGAARYFRTTSTSARWASTCRSPCRWPGSASRARARRSWATWANGKQAVQFWTQTKTVTARWSAHQERQHDDQHALRTVPEALRASPGRHCGPAKPAPRGPLGRASWIEGLGLRRNKRGRVVPKLILISNIKAYLITYNWPVYQGPIHEPAAISFCA